MPFLAEFPGGGGGGLTWPKETRTKLDPWTAITITLASLANGSSRQSSIISNSNARPAALVFIKIMSGSTAPTAGTVYEIYLLRGTGTSGERTDNAGASDAPITLLNAPLIGTLVVPSTANTAVQDIFDTAPLGPLGTEWGIAVKNASGQSLNATEANHVKRFAYYVPEQQ